VPEGWTVARSSTSPEGRASFRAARESARQFGATGDPFDLVQPLEWHRTVFEPLAVEPPILVGNYRTSDVPELQLVSHVPYEGQYSAWACVQPELVDEELRSFIEALGESIPGALNTTHLKPGLQVEAKLRVLAWTYAEWLRIHPFFDGNGRTALCWMDAVCARLEMPPFAYHLGKLYWSTPRMMEAQIRACRRATTADYDPLITLLKFELSQYFEAAAGRRAETRRLDHD
jgi:hypothetical protein